MNFKEFLVSKEVSDITKLDAEAQAGLEAEAYECRTGIFASSVALRNAYTCNSTST